MLVLVMFWVNLKCSNLVLLQLLEEKVTDVLAGVNKIGTICNVALIIIFIIWFPVGSINTPKTNNTHAVSLSMSIKYLAEHGQQNISPKQSLTLT